MRVATEEDLEAAAIHEMLESYASQVVDKATNMNPAPSASPTSAGLTAARAAIDAIGDGLPNTYNCVLDSSNWDCPDAQTGEGGGASSSNLLLEYAPELHYDSQEMYSAASPAEITDTFRNDKTDQYSNALKSDSETILVLADPVMADSLGYNQLSIYYLGAAYANTAPAFPEDHIDEANHYESDYTRLFAGSSYNNQAYGRLWVDPATGDKYLQYWFFYYYNAKAFTALGVGEHEGDWESIQLHLDAANFPLTATYSQHGGQETCSWSSVSTSSTGGPIVFVGHESHANYFRSGTHDLDWGQEDYTNGLLVNTPQVTDISPPNPPSSWVNWPGSWGGTTSSVFGAGGESPKAPINHSEWLDPVGWETNGRSCTAGQSFAPNRAAPSAAGVPRRRAVTPPPRLNALRDRSKVIVRFCFNSINQAIASRPWWLVVSVDSRQDRFPPYTVKSRVRSRCGTIQQPKGPATGQLYLLVRAISKTGAPSRLQTVRIR